MCAHFQQKGKKAGHLGGHLQVPKRVDRHRRALAVAHALLRMPPASQWVLCRCCMTFPEPPEG